jgi:hypothetical protein
MSARPVLAEIAIRGKVLCFLLGLRIRTPSEDSLCSRVTYSFLDCRSSGISTDGVNKEVKVD